MKATYDQMWCESRAALLGGIVNIDSNIDCVSDQRRGLSLVIRYGDSLSDELRDFLLSLQHLEPHQYHYHPMQLHFTVLSIISCHNAFKAKNTDFADYIEIVGNCLDRMRPFHIDVNGITASKDGVMLQGFDTTGALNDIRTELRSAFIATQITNSIDQRYALQTAHCTIMRFKQPLSKTDRLVALLDANRNQGWGTVRAEKMVLCSNDWYHTPGLVDDIDTFTL